MILMNLVLCGCCFSSNPASCLCVWFVCVSVHLHNTEIFQCFLSAREVARSRDRERASSSTGLGSGSVSRSGGGGGGEDDTILSQEGRRGSTGLPEGQDLYTAACNSVIHRCALLLLGVSPVLGELTKQNQEEGQTQSATGTQECLSFMTRSERCTPSYSLINQLTAAGGVGLIFFSEILYWFKKSLYSAQIWETELELAKAARIKSAVVVKFPYP